MPAFSSARTTAARRAVRYGRVPSGGLVRDIRFDIPGAKPLRRTAAVWVNAPVEHPALQSLITAPHHTRFERMRLPEESTTEEGAGPRKRTSARAPSVHLPRRAVDCAP